MAPGQTVSEQMVSRLQVRVLMEPVRTESKHPGKWLTDSQKMVDSVMEGRLRAARAVVAVAPHL